MGMDSPGMPVHQVRIPLPLDAIPLMEEILAETQDPRWMVIEMPDTDRSWLTGFFENREVAAESWRILAPSVRSLVEESELETTQVADRDWKESYKAHFKAWRSGPVHWVPIWERDAYDLPEGHVAVWLDPGMAFGTGNHETTRLCLERLTGYASELEAEGVSLSTVPVIDAGCGSGILAISAALLGFAPVFGFDLDSEAVRVSRENAALNGVVDRIVFEEADLKAGLRGRVAGLVLANIQADILVEGRDLLLGSVRNGGGLVMSGILTGELNEVRERFMASVPDPESESRSMGEWSDLLLRVL